MSLAFVSTMNKKLYDEYGKRFINEFIDNAHEDIKLFIIFEGNCPGEIINLKKNLITIPLMNAEHNKFIKFFGNLFEAKGLKVRFFEENGQKKINLNQDYKFNAVRFSFKPFSIHQVLQYLPDDLEYLIWTDADLRCKKDFNFNSLQNFLPNKDELMSYLGRRNQYSECGFLGFNLEHNEFENFINRIIKIYTSGEIFSLQEWHDSYIWDHVRSEYEDKEVKFKNISNKGFDHYHPFINSGLEEFFDHLKGPNRKKDGASPEKDYLNK